MAAALGTAVPSITPNPGSERNIGLRKHLDGRLAGMKTYRYSWWVHWRELADYILPRRYKWLITPNQWNRGSPINQHIIDSTGTIAGRNLASGLMSGKTSPSRPWFKAKIGRQDSTQTSPISLWLAEVERLILLILAESNFYSSAAIFYFDLVVFGTAVMIIYEDFEDVIHCWNPCAGEYYLENSDRMVVDTCYREFTLTINQVVQQFGINSVSTGVQSLWKTGAGSLSREIIVAHAIEPNRDFAGSSAGIPRHFPWREVYWEWGQAQTYILRTRGFHENPAIVARWDLVSNDPYGRSPAMDALPDIKQLQQEQRRKAQGIDKHVNPPMVADIQMKNQPASLLPGGVTYVPGFSQTKSGFAPVYQVAPDLSGIMEDIKEVQERIKLIFFNNLFQAISQYEPKSNVTAVEMDMRKAETLVMLGPVMERLDREFLTPVIERVFSIATRAGIIPRAPGEIQGQPITLEFISMLTEAQSASKMAGIDRILSMATNIAGATGPEVFDNIDVDEALDQASSMLGNSPKIIRSPAEVLQIRTKRQQDQAQQQAIQSTAALGQTAKNLSGAQLKGGGSVLDQLMPQGGKQ